MDTHIDAGLWLRRPRPAPHARVRLICFPHAGGAASYFAPVSAALAPQIEVLAVQYPGRQDRLREPCAGTVDELAEAVAAALASEAAAAGPDLALFGHSLGASVAFETARRLESSGTRIAALFASGRRSPSTPRDEGTYRLGTEQFVEMIRALGATDPRLFADDEVRDMVLPALRADYAAADRYRLTPGPPLTCPIHVLVGQDDDRVTESEALAWAQLTEGGFTSHRFPGGHFYLNDQVSEILAVIRAALGQDAVGVG